MNRYVGVVKGLGFGTVSHGVRGLGTPHVLCGVAVELQD